MQLTRIEGLPPAVKPVALSMSLASRIAGDAVFGVGGERSLEEADADPRQVRHLSPAAPEPPTEGERAEAQRKFVQADRLCKPADPRLVAFWCGRLRSLPFAPADDHAIARAIEGICIACAGLPGAVWSEENLAEALRAFTRWPAPAQVYALQAEKAKPFLRTRDGLKRLLAQPVPPKVVEPRVPPSPQAIAEVEAVTRALKAEFRRYAPSQALASGRAPTTLSVGTLLATYERLAERGDGSAKIRVEMLRKQLAQEAAE